MKTLRVLSLAAATGRVGHVFLVGRELKDWGLSRKASYAPYLAKHHTRDLIKRLRPDVVVSEKISPTSRKGLVTHSVILAIGKEAAQHELLDVAQERTCTFANKYEEIEALAQDFPELKSRAPKARKYWKTESRQTTVFEALSMAKTIIDGPTPALARAMG